MDFPTLKQKYRTDHQIPSGARSFTAQMHWDRMQSNANLVGCTQMDADMSGLLQSGAHLAMN